MAERKIRKELVKYIDKKLEFDGVAKLALHQKNARILFLRSHEAFLGIREEGGNNKGKLVELIQDTVGGVMAEPWCMSSTQSLLAYVEEKLNIKSPIYASEHCLTVWNKTDEKHRVRFMPLPGAIIIWQHGSSSSGHTGCLIGTDTEIMYTYEGNTEKGLEGGKLVREGGGFYLNKRGYRYDGNMRVKGFLIPF